MNINDFVGDNWAGNGGYPQPEEFDYHKVEERRAEQQDTDEYRAWVKKYREWEKQPVKRAGPYCHRCSAKIDQRRTGNDMAPYQVYDRGTNNLHSMRCFDRRRK